MRASSSGKVWGASGCGRGGASFLRASARRIGSPDCSQNSTRSRDDAGSAASRACCSGVKDRGLDPTGPAVAGDGTGAGLGRAGSPAGGAMFAGRGSGSPASAGRGASTPGVSGGGERAGSAGGSACGDGSGSGGAPYAGPTRPPGVGRPSPRPRGPARPGPGSGPYAGSRTAAP